MTSENQTSDDTGCLWCPLHDLNLIRTPDGDCIDCPDCEMGEPDIIIFAGPRRCPQHGEVISSDDGMFDGVCNACEGEMSEAAEEWEHNSENRYRKHCGFSVWGHPIQPRWLPTQPRYGAATCLDVTSSEDDIPF